MENIPFNNLIKNSITFTEFFKIDVVSWRPILGWICFHMHFVSKILSVIKLLGEPDYSLYFARDGELEGKYGVISKQ